jgi:hypothetical protein
MSATATSIIPSLLRYLSLISIALAFFQSLTVCLRPCCPTTEAKRANRFLTTENSTSA